MAARLMSKECITCGEHIAEYDSSVELAVLTGELDSKSRILVRDKCIKCSPSRAQRIIHPQYAQVFDDRPTYDMRLWDEGKRSKWVKIYTDAWVKLQEKHNPNWKDVK